MDQPLKYICIVFCRNRRILVIKQTVVYLKLQRRRFLIDIVMPFTVVLTAIAEFSHDPPDVSHS